MHTYRQSETGLWTVGFYEPRDHADTGALYYRWYPLADFASEVEAIARVNHLNGGNNHVNVYVMEP